jgi:5'(3')-deoxyribonucleotidase
MEKKTVLVDVDDVLVNYSAYALHMINNITKKEYNLSEFGWDFSEHPDIKKINGKFWNMMFSSRYAANVKPFEKSKEGLTKLGEVANIFICTSLIGPPYDLYCADRIKQLKRDFGIIRKNIIFAHAKYLCKADMLIDDRLINVERWKDNNPNGIAVRWKDPSDPRPFENSDKIEKISDWDSIIELLTN